MYDGDSMMDVNDNVGDQMHAIHYQMTEHWPTLGFDRSGTLCSVNSPANELLFGGHLRQSVYARIAAKELLLPMDAALRSQQSSRRLLEQMAAARAPWGHANNLVVQLKLGSHAQYTPGQASALVEVDVFEVGDTTSTASTSKLHFCVVLLRPTSPRQQSERLRRQASEPQQISATRLLGLALDWRENPPKMEDVYRTLDVVTAKTIPTKTLAAASEPHVRDEDKVMAEGASPVEPDKSRKYFPSAEELKSLVDHVPTMCFTADATGQVNWLNEAWNEYTGLTEEITPEIWASMFHPDDLPIVLPIWIESMTKGTPFRFQYRVKRQDGILRWCVCSGRAVKDKQGRVISWACSIADVEDLVVAQQQSLRVKEHVNAVVTGAALLLLSTDCDGVITLLEGSRTLLYCIVDMNAGNALPTVGERLVFRHDALRKARGAILAGKQSHDLFDLEGVDGDGNKIIGRFHLAPLIDTISSLDARIGGVTFIGSDVTKSLATEAALRASRDEKDRLRVSALAAEEASRLKTDFLTSLSHELRSPIAALLSICELLLDDASLSSDNRFLVARAARAGDALLELIGTILDVRKIEAGELTLDHEPLMLSDLIEDARVFSVAAEQKGLVFKEDIGPLYTGPVLGDKVRVRQVISNALTNALKFTEEGEIVFRVRQTAEATDMVELTIEVCDTGCGIDEKTLPTLFQPFKQADASTARQYGGSGLGLVISRKLMELMGGSCELTSVLGVGSTNTITVKLAKGPEEMASPSLPSQIWVNAADQTTVDLGQSQPRNSSDYRILLAEDNELLRDLITRILRKLQFQVASVPDGASAVAAVHQEHFDLVLMDGQMPITSGYAATVAIRSSPVDRVRTLPIVALTASAIKGDQERCMEAGMSGYLSKPVRAKDLEQMIWMQLDRARARARVATTPATTTTSTTQTAATET